MLPRNFPRRTNSGKKSDADSDDDFEIDYSTAPDTPELPNDDPTVEDFTKATELWIQDVVKYHNFCPFVNNNYKIVVANTPEYREMVDVFVKEARALADMDIPNDQHVNAPCTLVVLPYVLNPLGATKFYELALEAAEGLVGSMKEGRPEHSGMKVYSMVFIGYHHLKTLLYFDANQVVPLHDVAPFTTVQLLRYSDIIHARGWDGSMQRLIRDRNQRTNAKKFRNNEERMEILAQCMRGIPRTPKKLPDS
jgi:hypothetical protein